MTTNRLKKSFTLIVSVLILCALFISSGGGPAFAGMRWAENGVLVCDADGNEVAAHVIPDGCGGSIVMWMDYRHDPSGVNPWIYAQRIDSSGDTLWQENGVPICGAAQIDWPDAIPDGRGGAIVTWGDARAWPKWQVSAQRVDAGGNMLWAKDGIAICDGSGYGDVEGPRPRLAADGNGGAIIAWPDFRRDSVGFVSDIYAQRVDGNGNALWIKNGIRVSPLPDAHSSPIVCSDDSGGAIISYSGPRLSQYVQRVSGDGKLLWPENGVEVLGPRPVGGLTQNMSMVADGLGGAILSWGEDRTYPERCYDVYCQRVSSEGGVLWARDGVPVMVTDRDEADLPESTAIADGGGGGIITWVDKREGAHNKLYAQKIDAAGNARWAKNGIVVAGGDADKAFPVIVSDGLGGGIINWLSGQFNGSWSPRLQRLGPDGELLWGEAGIRPSNTLSDYNPCPMDTDAAGSAVISWGDLRNGGDPDIYAQRIPNPPPDPTWYLAEGSTAWGFSTYVTIENQNSTAVSARLTYMDPNASTSGRGVIGTRTISLPPRSQTTVNPREDIGNVDFSTQVDCLEGKSIAVDRTMTWTGAGAVCPESHNSIGVTAPGRFWCMPEGSSNWGFETWTLVENPNSAATDVTLIYMTEDSGAIVVPKTIPGYSRATYNMIADIGVHDASVMVVSQLPVIAESSQYRNGRREGSCSIGATRPGTDYFLAEGSTAWGFATYVLVQNPDTDNEANVEITYMTPNGPKKQAPFAMPPNSRKTIKVNDVPGVGETDLSTLVHSDQPIVAQRSMYWNGGPDGAEVCHSSIGLDSAHMSFYLPDGQSTGGWETWTLIANPNPGAVRVEVTYLPENGTAAPVTFTDEIPTGSRKTYNMAGGGDSYPGFQGRASIAVRSLDGARPIMVERAMYSNSRGAGTDTIGGYSD